MKALLKVIKWIGVIFLVLIVFGIGNIFLQEKHAIKMCSSYKAGDPMPSVEELDSKYLLHPMGPFELKEKPGLQRVIFCASATMCDVACEITFKDGQISEIEYATSPRFE